MAVNKCYYVKYQLRGNWDEAKGIAVLAPNKWEAYMKAVYEAIPAKEETLPYSAWVHSVTFNNGNYKVFNTFAGKPV